MDDSVYVDVFWMKVDKYLIVVLLIILNLILLMSSHNNVPIHLLSSINSESSLILSTSKADIQPSTPIASPRPSNCQLSTPSIAP